MTERLNKTSICSIVFLDIVEYSQKPVSQQIELKDRFNAIISEAIKDVAQNDRIILDTGDGAAITLLGEPETALFISLTMHDAILTDNIAHPDCPLLVRIGINLGPVRLVKDINGHTNIIGDGINVAQRVMSFSEPNQILVSRSYFEIVSRLTGDMLKMFSYSGIKHDKHVREHEVYVILPQGENGFLGTPGTIQPASAVPAARFWTRHTSAVGAGLFVLALMVGSLGVWKVLRPHVAAKPTVSRTVIAPAATPAAPAPQPAPAGEQTARKADASPPAPPATKKKSKHLDEESQPATNDARANHQASPAAKKDEQDKPASEKSGWEKFKQSIKQGTKKPACTEAQRSLHQCK
jgi:hypothetical protein